MIELFRRNFDADEPSHARAQVKPSGENGASEVELSDLLEEARQKGFAEGVLKGQEQAAEEANKAAKEKLLLEKTAIAQQLSEILEQDKRRRQDSEKDLIDLFLAIAERVVPDFLEAYGLPLSIKKIEECVRRNQAHPKLTVRGCPSVIEKLQEGGLDWLEAEVDAENLRLETDPEFNAGAAHVIWSGGHQEYDVETACVEIMAALRAASQKYLSKE